MKNLPWFRIVIQISAVLLFCGLPLIQIHGFTALRGSLFAFDAFGVPFADPASAAQAGLAGWMQGESPMPMFFAGALVTLVIAFLLGRVFCGWLCPYGFFSDLLAKRRVSAKPQAKNEFLFKAILLLLAICAGSMFAYPAIILISMPGQLSLLPGALWLDAGWLMVASLAALPAAALVIEGILGQRLWCRHVCPQSVLLGLAASLMPASAPGLRIRWNSRKCGCGKNAPCRQACKLGLNPRHKNGPPRRDCSMCGDCVARCGKFGRALQFGIAPAKNK